MKLKLICYSFWLVFCNLVIAQSNGAQSVVPTSPTGFEFLKYGEIPISKYTGSPSISIPIYTINSKGFSLPIQLSYHSNGFRVDEESGWTGLGWTLNPGGNIVQIVNGADDFGLYSNREFPDVDTIIDVSSNGNGPGDVLTNCTGTNTTIASNKFVLPQQIGGSGGLVSDSLSNSIPYDLVMGYKDYEPDVFKFNILGYSGTFVLDWTTETFKCLTDSKIEIESVPGEHDTIVIVLPGNIRCEFSVKEETVAVVSFSGTGGFNITSGQKTSRVYKVDRISNLGDNVDFYYTITDPIKNYPTRSEQSVGVEDNGPYTMAGNNGLQVGGTSSFFLSEQPISYLNKIVFNQGVLLFNMSNRVDIQGSKKLDNIQLKEAESSNVVIRNFDFDYEYFVGHTNGTYYYDSYWDGYLNGTYAKTLTERTHRLKLKSITEAGKNPYVFEYNNTQLPQKISFATDYWGKYNGYLSNSSMFPNLYRLGYNVEQRSFYDQHSNNNKSSRLEFSKAAVLEKITYPTLGYTTFDYELNSFSNFLLPNFNDGYNTSFPANYVVHGAGLRVQKIKTFDHNNEPISQKIYTYEGGRLMSPMRYFNRTRIPSYYYITAYSGQTGSIVHYGSGYRTRFSSNSFATPSTTASGSFVGYDKVVEHLVSKDDDTETIGRIEDYYENHIDQGDWPITSMNHWDAHGEILELNMPLYERSAPRNGSVLEQKIFNKGSSLVQSTTNTYGYGVRYNCANGIKLGPEIFRGYPQAGSLGSASQERRFKLGVYPIRGLDSYLSTTETINYYEDGDVLTFSEYSYNERLQLIEKKTLTSDGDNIVESYTPFNKCPATSSQHTIEYNGKTNYGISTMYMTCDKNSAYDVTDWVRRKRIQSTYGINSNTNNIINLLSTSLNNGKLKTQYIWDYYGKYPIVKIQYNRDVSVPNSWITNVINASQNFDSEGLRSALNTFRNNLKNMGIRHVETYTYENLVGVKTITDATGKTTYFNYDEFYRLDYVTDHNGNRVSENDYNYKIQN